MRMIILVTVGLLVVFSALFLLRDTLRPAAEADLGLLELSAHSNRNEISARLANLDFNCTDDQRIGAGEQACFAPIARADQLQADYLALYFDADDHLAAVNVVLSPDHHEFNLSWLESELGAITHEVHGEQPWLVWRQADGLIMTQSTPPAEGAPTLLWFREAAFVERLLPSY